MCAIGIEVIFTVNTAIVSLLYLSVTFTTEFFFVLVFDNGPPVSVRTNYKIPGGEKNSNCL